MAIGFKKGAGGPNLLNFKVVGGTSAPPNPKENMIWVDTQAEITGYSFSITEPAEPFEGMVWIVTGISSSAQFNALKKNALQVYPISAKQYVSGSWAEVTAQLYQAGQWAAFFVDFYNHGNVYEPMTGGWKHLYQSYSALTITFNEDHMLISKPASSASWVGTAKKVNLSGKSRLYIDCSKTGSGAFMADLTTAIPTSSSRHSIASIGIPNGDRQVLMLDISQLSTTECHICFRVDAPNEKAYLYVYRVWAE